MIARRSRSRRKSNGFALVESVIAFLLVSLGIVGLLMMSARSSRASQEAYERVEAINLATQISNKVKATGDGVLDWSGIDVVNPATWTTSDPSTLESLNQLKSIATNRLHDTTATVTMRAPDGVTVCAAPPCEMIVDVRWKGASELSRSYALYAWVGLQ